MKKLILLLLLLLGVNSFSDTYHYVSISSLMDQEIGEIIMTKLYENVGDKITISRLPGKRAALEATRGEKDGEIMRIYSYGDTYPMMKRIPTPYYYVESNGFIKKDRLINVQSKDDLKNYTVGIIRGVKISEELTVGVPNLQHVNNTEQLFRMLNSGRIDIAITNTLDGNVIVKKLGYSNIGTIEKPLLKLDLYHYVHEKNSHLVHVLDQELMRMKKSGELADLVKEAEGVITKRHSK